MNKKSKPKFKPLDKLIKINSKIDKQLSTAIADYKGEMGILESAIGALIIGQHFGWRVLFLCHTRKTISNYEDILGIKYVDHCPEEGDLAGKSLGLKIVKKLGGFWKIVKGEKKIDNKKHVE